MKIPQDMRPGTVHTSNNCGDFEIVEYINARNVKIRFIKDWFFTEVRSDSIRNGKVRNPYTAKTYGVGFVGEGVFDTKSTHCGIDLHLRWVGVLQRCYDEDFQKRKPSHKDCTVDPRWHNFQSFATWFVFNYPDDGGVYELDKDIKIPGNRVYSPDACLFVTPEENAAARRWR